MVREMKVGTILFKLTLPTLDIGANQCPLGMKLVKQ